MPEKKDDITGAYSQLLFACSVCKKVYKKPGVCPDCDVLLKPKGG